jgi:hypothetical protein
MAQIATYPLITPKAGDLLIGSETYDVNEANPVVGNPTRNFTVSSVVQTLPSTSLILPAYADDAAAGTAGLTTGKLYQTSGSGSAPLNVAGIVMIKQ